MLKRKANDDFSTKFREQEENLISSVQEISQRKIFRARRPVRSVPENNSGKFKVLDQLISKEEEKKLLENCKKVAVHSSYYHSRTKSANPYDFNRFSNYAVAEPLKEIIQNFHNEGTRLQNFLQSSLEKSDQIVKFSVDCDAEIENCREKVNCQIVINPDRSIASMVLSRTCDKEVLVRKRITRESVCKEIIGCENQAIYVAFYRELKKEEHFRLEMNVLAKPLFLRCFFQYQLLG